MDFKQIQELIKIINKSNIGEIRIEEKDFKISIRAKEYIGSKLKSDGIAPIPSSSQPEPATTSQPTPDRTAEKPEEAPGKSASESAELSGDESNYMPIKSPMIGTFYRSPAPDKDTYVKVGDTIQPGDVVCTIEAMKLFNEIESEVAGKVVKVLVENASPVEYDQELFLVDPA